MLFLSVEKGGAHPSGSAPMLRVLATVMWHCQWARNFTCMHSLNPGVMDTCMAGQQMFVCLDSLKGRDGSWAICSAGT